MGADRRNRYLSSFMRTMQFILSRLESRSTKTVGKEFGHRIVSQCRRLEYGIGFDLPMELRQHLSIIRNIRSRDLRETAIRDLRQALDLISRLQSESSELRVRSLEKEIEQLQLQVDQLSPSEDEDDPQLSCIEQVDVSSENALFVIIPFSKDFEDVWKGGIKMAAEEEGFVPIRIDEINRSTNITDDIIEAIKSCRIAIVDVTGNNPNVMFELGYTLAKAKKNIIISQSAEDLPFDIRNIRAIEYSDSWSGIEELRERVKEFLRDHKTAKVTKKKGARKLQKKVVKKKAIRKKKIAKRV